MNAWLGILSEAITFLRRERGRGFAGDGSDGNVTLGAGTTTLTRSMYYGDLVIPSGSILVPNGHYVFANGEVTVEGTFDVSGSDADVTVGGAPPPDPAGGATAASTGPIGTGQAGANGAWETGSNVNGDNAGDLTSSGYVLLGGSGGNGGDAATATGGVGGDANDPSWPIRHAAFILNQLRAHLSGASNTPLYRGGMGGGSGACQVGTSAVRGAGGGGGGIGVIVANRVSIGSTGIFTANGGAGGDGLVISSNGAAGGGGGGGGFGAILAAEYANAGSFTASGGSGGTADGTANNGDAGEDGIALFLEI